MARVVVSLHDDDDLTFARWTDGVNEKKNGWGEVDEIDHGVDYKDKVMHVQKRICDS